MPIVQRDIRDLDRRAVQVSIDLVRLVGPADLGRSTPCQGWTLADLLAHMTAQHRGFRAASLGRGRDLARWAPGEPPADPAAEYERAARAVLAAFGGAAFGGAAFGGDGSSSQDDLERAFALPEIGPEFEIPASQAIGFHFIDYVVHGWDVARSLGQPYFLDDELAPTALQIAYAVPDGPSRLRSNASFRPSLPAGEPGADGEARDDGPPLDRILRRLGRSPNWPK